MSPLSPPLITGHNGYAKLLACALGAACALGLGGRLLFARLHDYTATGPDGTTHRLSHVSFGNRRTIKLLRIGDATMEGYESDQVEGLKAVAEGVAKGLAQGAKPVP